MVHSKKPKQAVSTTKGKLPAESVSYHWRAVSFSFRKYDFDSPWANSSDGKPTVDSVFHNLRGFEGMTWRSVIQASGGRSRGTNSHYIHIENMIKEARQRLEALKYNETELFSMRLQGTVRLFGTIDPKSGCFFVLWYDPAHAICPMVR